MAGERPARADGRATRWAGQRERRRAEFVAAALQVIERDGADAHVAAIAAQAGVARTVVYRHFADRADLDRAIAEGIANDLLDHLAPLLVLAVPTLVELESAVTATLTGYLDYLQAHPQLGRFVRAHEVAAGAASARRLRSGLAEHIADVLRPLLAAGSGLAPSAAGVVASGLVGLADAALARWLAEPATLKRTELLDCIAVLARGAAAAAVGPTLRG